MQPVNQRQGKHELQKYTFFTLLLLSLLLIATPKLQSVEASHDDDRIIVIFDADQMDGISAENLINQLLSDYDGTLHYTYNTAIQGFAASFSAEDRAAIQSHPAVLQIEDEGVRRKSEGLLEHAPVGAGDEVQ